MCFSCDPLIGHHDQDAGGRKERNRSGGVTGFAYGSLGQGQGRGARRAEVRGVEYCRYKIIVFLTGVEHNVKTTVKRARAASRAPHGRQWDDKTFCHQITRVFVCSCVGGGGGGDEAEGELSKARATRASRSLHH